MNSRALLVIALGLATFASAEARDKRPRSNSDNPNVKRAMKKAKKVKCDGEAVCVADSTFKTSTGDEAGSAMGVASSKTKGKAEFVNYSFDVKIEGKGVPRAFDLMLHNDKNTPPFPVLQGPLIAMGGEDPVCLVCEKARG
jgi:hypothetical protein